MRIVLAIIIAMGFITSAPAIHRADREQAHQERKEARQERHEQRREEQRERKERRETESRPRDRDR